MLKQLFNKEQILKAFTSKDVWRWNVLDKYGDVETAAGSIARTWKENGLSITGLRTKVVKGKTVFFPESIEDALAIRLVDRYVRRIYKVRQSDRNRMVKQVAILLKDPGDLTFIRLDISQCYESIVFDSMLKKIREDLILSPGCMKILKSVSSVSLAQGLNGLPRGLSISTTLAELYLEKLDAKLARNINIVYMARYVDDIVIVVPDSYVAQVSNDVEYALTQLRLTSNPDKKSFYKVDLVGDNIDLLGYFLSSKSVVNKGKVNQNDVFIKISDKKINKIKNRVALSFINYKNDQNFQLLKDRIYFLSSLSVIKKGRNGELLAGNAYNYIHAHGSDCLKKIDGFYLNLLKKTRFDLSLPQQETLKKISFYRNAQRKKVMNITRSKMIRLKQAWINE